MSPSTGSPSSCRGAWALWAAGVALLGGARPVATQDGPSLSTVEISAGPVALVRADAVEQDWRSGLGAHLSFLSGYGAGTLRFSIEAEAHRGRRAEAPDHLVLFPSLEWGLSLGLPAGLRGYAVAGLGAYWMSFEEGRNPQELEMAVTATAQLRRDLGRGWTGGLGVRARRVFLARPLDQAHLSLEIGRRVRLSAPLRRALADASLEPPARAEAPPAGEGAGESAPEPPPGARVPPSASIVAAADLRSDGVLRPSEVLRAVPGWDLASIDHRTFWAAPEGLSPFEDGRWEVLVDGIPVPIEVLGVRTLDRLPLAVGDVLSVEALGVPGLRYGSFRDGGLLHFRTGLPASQGFEIHAQSLAENPTGDPGAFLYTDSTLNNVDKLGVGYDAGARWRRGAVGGAVGLRYLSDMVTDARLEGRMLSLRDPELHYPVIRTLAGWVALRVEGDRGRHDLRLGRTVREDYFFLPALGFELPAESLLLHLGAAGSVRAFAGLDWQYRAFSAWSDLEDTPNYPDLGFDLHTRRRGAATAVSWEGRHRVSLGAGWEDESVLSRFLREGSERTTLRTHADAAASVGAARLGLDLELRRTDREWGGAIALTAGAPVPWGASLRGTVWHSRSPGGDETGFWGLFARGYDFLSSAGVEVEEPADALAGGRARRESGAQLELADLSLGGSLALSPFVRASRVRGLTVARASFVPDGFRPTHDGPILLSRSAAGRVVAAGAVLRWTPAPSLEAEARYRWLRAGALDPFFASAWEALPAHRGTQRVRWTMRPDLRLSLLAEALSATRWAGYEGMQRERTGASLHTSVSLEKALWDGRVSLHGRVTDLLDRKQPLHPLGSAPGVAFAVGGTVRLGTLR